jgi:hypothetical protein
MTEMINVLMRRLKALFGAGCKSIIAAGIERASIRPT